MLGAVHWLATQRATVTTASEGKDVRATITYGPTTYRTNPPPGIAPAARLDPLVKPALLKRFAGAPIP